jgi:hypothetical protein
MRSVTVARIILAGRESMQVATKVFAAVADDSSWQPSREDLRCLGVVCPIPAPGGGHPGHLLVIWPVLAILYGWGLIRSLRQSRCILHRGEVTLKWRHAADAFHHHSFMVGDILMSPDPQNPGH